MARETDVPIMDVPLADVPFTLSKEDKEADIKRVVKYIRAHWKEEEIMIEVSSSKVYATTKYFTEF